MIVSLPSVGKWQVLRALVRSDAPMIGSELRLDRRRSTLDGTFLDWFVSSNLIEAVEVMPEEPPTHAYTKPVPQQFRTLYRLTEMGARAADTGEYDIPNRKRAPLDAANAERSEEETLGEESSGSGTPTEVPEGDTNLGELTVVPPKKASKKGSVAKKAKVPIGANKSHKKKSVAVEKVS